MLVALISRDKPGALSLRLETRDAHVAWLKAADVVRLAGPLLEDGSMIGSLVVIETESPETARDWAATDPYAKAGLFASVEAIEWRRVIG